ncbi:hypothetical protein JHN52_01275 [Streptomyces sp. MBT97]|uniref:hypothetical protein n=1 Tax=Streptomyces sp. MBT97 TaxID=2800411 RepID=UPI00190E51F1|nr:hypothetical protein [Streptomyces sp. MBT97]MBK3631612.1 hypothetical protein [Streptomyces sp. MBT97]
MRRTPVDHAAVAARCRANPGQWQEVGEYGSGESASAMVRAISGPANSRVRAAYAPAGSFEARRELTDMGARVEARYIGDSITDVETAVRELGALPVPAGSWPKFFCPGRLYTRDLPYRAPEDRPSFQCVGVGRHPSKGGALRAFGFEQPGVGRPWASAAQRMEEWEEGWLDLGRIPDRLTRTFAPTQTLREDHMEGTE